MRTQLTLLIAMLALVGSVPSGAQSSDTPRQAAVQPAPAPGSAFSVSPVDAQLSTVVDHARSLAGQVVRLRAARIERVVSAGIVELKDAREDDSYRFHIYYYPDRLLAVLPAGTTAARGEVILVAGTLQTVGGAALTKQMPGASADLLKHGNRPVLLATTATTVDGVALTAAR